MRRSLALITTGTIAITTMLTSCGTGAQEKDNPWRETIQAAAEEAESDFVRQVLSDGDVTEEEHRESIDRWIACMKDHGFTASYELDEKGNPAYVTQGLIEEEAAQDSASAECEQQWLGTIGAYYWAMRENPENKDPAVLYTECFIRHGLVPQDFTVEDYHKAWDDFDETGELPWDVDDPAYNGCETAPTQ